MKSVVEHKINIGVELFDWEYERTGHVCAPPVSESREFHSNWDDGHGYHKQIVQLFENFPPMYQAMIPVGRCATGRGAYEHTTVIFFDALNAEDEAWDVLEEEMRSILPSNVGIEIQQRTSPLFCVGDDWKDDFSLKDYMRPPRLGCEVGVEGSLEAGTMGGYVITEARDTKERTTFGLTNAHVVFDKREETRFKAAGAGIKVQSPCENTHRRDRKELPTKVQKSEKEIQDLNYMIEGEKDTNPNFCRRLEKRLAKSLPKNTSLKNALTSIERDPSIGSVKHARLGDTDYTIGSSQAKLIMDLALIEMDCLEGQRPQEISLKQNDRRPSIPEDTTYNSWKVDSLGNSIKVVAKISREGFYSMGVVSKFQADTFPFVKNGKEVLQEVSVWAIITPERYNSQIPSWKGAVFPSKQPASGLKDNAVAALNHLNSVVGFFSRSGDSGSLILAAANWKYDTYNNNNIMMPSQEAAVPNCDLFAGKPFVVGLLCGTSTNADISYFIPFDAVKSEIECLTGEQVVWPKRRSECVPRWEKGYDDDDDLSEEE